MKTYILQVVEDRALGELGLIVKGVRLMGYPMVAREGRLIAHDITEHMHGLKSIGSVDDELEALGAVYYGRGQCGEFGNPTTTLQYDVEELCRIYQQGVHFRNDVPRTKKLDEGEEEDIQNIVNGACNIVVRDLYDYGEWSASAEKDITVFRRAAIHFMRRGFRLAHRKYGSPIAMWDRFKGIERAVDSITNHIEYEGQKFKLSTTNNMHFRCEEIYEYDY